MHVKFYETPIQNTRIDVAKIAYTAMVQELGRNCAHLSDEGMVEASQGVARISFLFADAFLQESFAKNTEENTLRLSIEAQESIQASVLKGAK